MTIYLPANLIVTIHIDILRNKIQRNQMNSRCKHLLRYIHVYVCMYIVLNVICIYACAHMKICYLCGDLEVVLRCAFVIKRLHVENKTLSVNG